jgi:hypothetical protein
MSPGSETIERLRTSKMNEIGLEAPGLIGLVRTIPAEGGLPVGLERNGMIVRGVGEDQGDSTERGGEKIAASVPLLVVVGWTMHELRERPTFGMQQHIMHVPDAERQDELHGSRMDIEFP